MIINTTINLETTKTYDFIDITDQIKNILEESGIEKGFVNIQSLHTTGVIIINEKEPLLLKDFKRFLEKISPQSEIYQHDNFEIRTVNMCEGECANGHSHCKAILLPTSSFLNIKDRHLQLGMWQRIFFLELDRARPRQISIMIMGE